MSPNKMDPALAIEQAEIWKNRHINGTIAIGNSPVQRFYDGAVVFLTGGSGFLGKQIIEKLFRSCRIKKLYLLLRAKDQKSVKSRLHELLKDPLYDYLHKNKPDFIKKIVPVTGDVTKVKLGIDEDLWKIITNEVNVIIHSAATINFNERLSAAVLTNVRGTREVILLAKAVNNLKSFVHISTAYAHATSDRVKQHVMEQFYDPPICPDLLIQMVEKLDEELIEKNTSQLLKTWPNTYSFTKALAEELIRTTAADLPVCIVRPAIVLNSYRETPGWADKSTIDGPIGFIMGACLGGLHVMYGDVNIRLDMVPVDLVNNAVIAAAYQTALRHERKEAGIKIYTVTNTRNPMRIAELHDFFDKDARGLITPNIVWYGYVIITQSKLVLALLVWLLHYIPGYLVDGILILLGKKPKVNRLLTRAYKHNMVYNYYMMNDWEFGDKNLFELYCNLSPADRIIFNCDTDIVDVKHFLTISAIGSRKYLIKDGLQNTEYAVKKQKWLKICNYIFLSLYVYIFWKICVFLIGCCVQFVNISIK